MCTPVSGPNGSDRLAKLTREVPVGGLSLDIYTEQLSTGNARFCRLWCVPAYAGRSRELMTQDAGMMAPGQSG